LADSCGVRDVDRLPGRAPVADEMRDGLRQRICGRSSQARPL